jgi:two-component system response regulator FlrC
MAAADAFVHSSPALAAAATWQGDALCTTLAATPADTLEVDAAPAVPADLHSATRHNELRIILATLAATRSRAEAALRLGISPRTLRYKLAQMRAQGLVTEAEGSFA